MFAIHEENTVSLTEAAHALPTRPHVSTIWRWASRGCKGVKLETARIGGRTVTSTEAVERFIAALSSDDRSQAPARTPRQRRQEIAKADHVCVEAGL